MNESPSLPLTPSDRPTMARGSGNIPETELFWSLVDKADRKFSRLRDLANCGLNRNNADLHKAFKIYTRLWKLQQESRQKLVEAGLKRWEIGEIASRIAQIYYGQYQRTSEAAYLAEAYIFYEAILSREYFRDGSGGGPSQDPGLANKQLRFLARFLVVCLVLSRREMVSRLAGQLRSLVDECKRNFQEAEFKEWKQVVQEIVRFLKVDTPFMNMRPLRYSFLFDSPLDSLPYVASCEAKRGLKLRDAVLSSYHHNEAKFTELTLDTFRMLQCLEWEPCGSFSLTSGADTGQDGSGPNRVNPLQDIRDPTLPPNPQKVILYRSSVTNFLVVLATLCEELPPDGILLVYLSAAGKDGMTFPVPSSSGLFTNTIENIEGNIRSLQVRSPPLTSQSSPEDKENLNNILEGCLWLGSPGNGGSNCLYPCDLIPFTRRPLFLIVDSNTSHAFKAIHGAEKGEPIAMLLSPRSQSLAAAVGTDSVRYKNGSQFTMFLTAPLQAFCILLGIPSSSVDKDAYNRAEKLLSLSLKEWGMVLASSDSLNPVWIEVLGDPFLRRFLLRFIFCRTVLALSASTFKQAEYYPECLPSLPDSVLPESSTSQSGILRLANFFGVAQSFVFSESTVLPDPSSDDPTSINASGVHESHFSAENGH